MHPLPAAQSRPRLVTLSLGSVAANDIPSDAWTQLLSVLSPDAAPDFYRAMGVPVSDPGVLHHVLRGVILDARRLHEATPDRLRSLTAMLAEHLPVSEAAAFLRWARGVFLGYHADQPGWSAWDLVFSQWAYSRRNELSFLPELRRDARVATYRREVVTDDVRKQGEKAAERSLSDWDLKLFARCGYGITWESGPYSIIEAICRIERLKRFVALV